MLFRLDFGWLQCGFDPKTTPTTSKAHCDSLGLDSGSVLCGWLVGGWWVVGGWFGTQLLPTTTQPTAAARKKIKSPVFGFFFYGFRFTVTGRGQAFRALAPGLRSVLSQCALEPKMGGCSVFWGGCSVLLGGWEVFSTQTTLWA